MLAELADKAASVFMKVSDEQLRSRITALETELRTMTTGHTPVPVNVRSIPF
jgi:hypothetical protein